MRDAASSPVLGMGRSLQTGSSLIVSTFRTALFHQLLIILLVVVPLRDLVQHRADRQVPPPQVTRTEYLSDAAPAATTPEPLARRVIPHRL